MGSAVCTWCHIKRKGKKGKKEKKEKKEKVYRRSVLLVPGFLSSEETKGKGVRPAICWVYLIWFVRSFVVSVMFFCTLVLGGVGG